MNARSVARELALLAFSQISKNIDKIENKNIEDIVVTSIRTLTNDAENNLKTTVGALVEIRDFIENYEMEHPENIKRPLDVSNIPVQIPLTSDMIGRIDCLINAVDKTFSALEIAEISALSKTPEVRDYILLIANEYKKNSKIVDEEISKLSKGWEIGRLVRIDKNILRIAITELLYIKDTPYKVAIDEAVELAKKYSTEESSSFINGILRQVVEEYKLEK